MHQHKKLDFWNRSCQFCEQIYLETANFPVDERNYGLAAQLRRASISIPSNIAEGSSRDSNKDFKRFLRISLGSAFEVETQLFLAYRLQFIDISTFESLTQALAIIIRQIRKFKSILI